MSEKISKVLVIDDEPAVYDGIRRVLHRECPLWRLDYACDVDEGIAVALSICPDIVLCDINMPFRNGLEFIAEAVQMDSLKGTPIVMLTGNQDESLKRIALDLGALDLLSKPVQSANLVARLKSAIKLSECQRSLEQQNQLLERRVLERTQELDRSRREIVWRLAMACELRDSDTGEHIIRVSRLVKVIALSLGMTEEDADRMSVASSLHDIGKVAISDVILRKPSGLTPDEWSTMKSHTVLGMEILTAPFPGESSPTGTNDLIRVAAEIVRSHHEHWDGAGYPDGLSGESIPISARIVAVADVLDALRHERSYKAAMSFERAFQLVCAESGSHFDPQIIETIKLCKSELYHILGPETMRACSPVSNLTT